MGEGQRSNNVLVPQARRALDTFKYEIAREIGLNPPQSGYWGDYPSRQMGAIGGHMVRRMIQQAEQQLAGTTGNIGTTGTTTGGPTTTR